jgi:hypothetical protein
MVRTLRIDDCGLRIARLRIGGVAIDRLTIVDGRLATVADGLANLQSPNRHSVNRQSPDRQSDNHQSSNRGIDD